MEIPTSILLSVGAALSAAITALWGVHMFQHRRQNRRVDKLETQLVDCHEQHNAVNLRLAKIEGGRDACDELLQAFGEMPDKVANVVVEKLQQN